MLSAIIFLKASNYEFFPDYDTIQVIEKITGRSVSHQKVGIIFSGLMHVIAREQYTDEVGEAHFDEENGEVRIYINGKKVYDGLVEGRRVVFV